MVGTRGRGVPGFGEGPGYLFGGERGIVLVACEVEERGRWAFGGKKSGEGASPLPRLCQRPLGSPGTFVAGDERPTSWLSRGIVEWPRIRSPTSVPSWLM